MMKQQYAAVQQLLESLGFEVVYECCGSKSAKASQPKAQIPKKISSQGSFSNEEGTSDQDSHSNGMCYGSDCMESSSSYKESRKLNNLAPAKEPRKRLWQEWCVSADRELKCLVNGFGRDWERIGLIMERSPDSIRNRYNAIYAEDEESHQTNHQQKPKPYINHPRNGKTTPYDLPKDSCFSQKSTYMKSHSDSKNEFKTNSHHNFRQENFAMEEENKIVSLGKRDKASFEKIFDLSAKSDAQSNLETGLTRKRLKKDHQTRTNLLEDISKELFHTGEKGNQIPQTAPSGSLEGCKRQAANLSLAKKSSDEINNETKKFQLQTGDDKDTKVTSLETFEDLIFGYKTPSRQDQEQQENLFGSQEDFEDIFGHLSTPGEIDPFFDGLGEKKQSFASNNEEFEDLFREEKSPFE